MPGGFDFQQLLADPMVQIGIGLMSQQRQPGEGYLGGLGRGVMQGMQGTAAMNEILQRRQAQQMRQQLAESIRAQAPKPRPLAFIPQPGDEQVMRNYQEQSLMADALMAGGSPDAYFNRLMQRDNQEESRRLREALAQAEREAQMRRHGENLEERRLGRQSLEAYRNAALEQAKALRAMASGNVQPVQIVDPTTGQLMYVHPSQAYGKQAPSKTGTMSLNNEQKRQSAIAALDFADQELERLSGMVEQSPRSVGPAGLVQRGLETAKGFVLPSSDTPAIDIRNEQMNILATIRKRITDANASNRDIAQALEIIGGDLMATKGSTQRSIETLRKQLRGQREAMSKAAPNAMPSAGGGLTDSEQRELEELRRWKAGR